jgi:L-ascorbate metabolism protein UlaG (beta-lactamase superfamily)
MNIIEKIEWLGQACIRINYAGTIIYIDPYQLQIEDKANIIFITHSHYDHLSIEDIRKVATDATKIFAPFDCVPQLIDAGFKNVLDVIPGIKEETDSFNFETVPAYNIKKTSFHPKGNRWVGYILDIDGLKIYHAGDTERIPEMKDINCDIVLIPLGQTYTMNSVEDAVESVLDVKAKTAIPIHYGLYEGTIDDAYKFKDLLRDKVEVLIMEPKV